VKLRGMLLKKRSNPVRALKIESCTDLGISLNLKELAKPIEEKKSW
jgi:hypothetical protein